MQIINKLPDDTVNYGKQSLFIEFCYLLAGLFILAAVIYAALGVCVDYAASKISPQKELELFSHLPFHKSFAAATPDKSLELKLQAIVDRMLERSRILEIPLKAYVIDEKQENAFAVPGGIIVVTSGLIKKCNSENELAMVIGHEIGHFVLRHHLRSLGRGLVLAVIQSLILGSEGEGRVLGVPLQMAALRYSRKQEILADEIGLKLVNATYGHVNGATDFFKNWALEEDRQYKNKELLSFFSTHPFSRERVKHLEEIISLEKYSIEGQLLSRIR